MVAVLPAPTFNLILCSRFGSRFLGIHSVFIALNHVVVDSVFYVRRDVWTAKDPLIVGLVFCEQKLGVPLTIKIPVTQLGVGCGNCLCILSGRALVATTAWGCQATMSRCCETRASATLVTRPAQVPDSPR